MRPWLTIIAALFLLGAGSDGRREASGEAGSPPRPEFVPMANEILILPGSPDRVIASGIAIEEESTKAALRWSGVDLRWGDQSLRGKCIRLEIAVGPGRYEIRTDLAPAGEGVCSVELSVVAAQAPLDGVSAATTKVGAGVAHPLSAKIDLRDGPLDLFLKPDVGCWIGLAAVHIISLDRKGRPQLGTLIPSGAVPSAGPGGAQQSKDMETLLHSDRSAGERDDGARGGPNDVLRGPRMAPTETRACLREVCEYLVRNQTSSGLYDFESGAWWKASIAVRTLLAGYDLFRDPRYLASARRTLDAFVAEQAGDGGWCGFSRIQQAGTPCDRRNMADLGSMTACLSMIGRFLGREDARVYIAAHERYVRDFVSKHEAAGGGFRNGIYEERDWEWPYSVATATQATSLVSLYHATRDTTALRRAEKAAWFLLLDWETNGQPKFHPPDIPETVRLRATEIHDIYYLLEGILFVSRATKNPVLLDAARLTLRNYILGERGLLSELDSGWFSSASDPATLAKSCGMLAILVDARDLIGADPLLDKTIDAATGLLCSPATREAYRVLASPYAKPGDPAITCTSFAGLSFAEVIRPGLVFGAPTR
jgi:hypothetical protein